MNNSSANHPILLIFSYVGVFIIGMYVARRRSCVHVFIPSNETQTISTTAMTTMSNNSTNISRPLTFYEVGIKYGIDKITSHHYETMYEKYLRKYIGSEIHLLEIGLGCGMIYGPGKSAYTWREYLGPLADIHFVEWDKKCGEEWYNIHGGKLNINMHYGSQEDVAFLQTVNSTDGYFDVIIDDGGHTMKQQITSFKTLLSKVRSGGLYVVEDLQTSYFPGADSGYLVNTTMLSFIKVLVDDIQVDSPKESKELGQKLFSFELSNKICFFILK